MEEVKMVGEDDVVSDYEESLSDLIFNSKPLINMLTMLAAENIKFAPKIVGAIESRIQKVPADQKLPLIYLIDSIVKNHKNSDYPKLFSKNLVKTFVSVFEKVDEQTRASLHKLRNTWSTDLFPASKLYGIDIKVHSIDPAWPIHHPEGSTVANAASSSTVATQKGGKCYVNPAFINKEIKQEPKDTKPPRPVEIAQTSNGSSLADRQKEIQRLEQRKRKLEDEQQKLSQQEPPTSTHSSPKRPQLQSVVTIPPKQNRDPRIPAVSQPQPSTSSLGTSNRTEKHMEKPAPIESTKRHQDSEQLHDVDLRNRTLPPSLSDVDLRNRNAAPAPVPSLPPKKRKPQSPLTEPANHRTPLAEPTNNRLPLTEPPNNRIFVDGRAYEVRYIEDVAVIERNGLPHRINFVGTPRDVVVDGYAHTLAFGESKTISIDGQPHVIRFGAPSKELYVGPLPFCGSFGGPPIRATINGVQHKIQLCGPPPEVKIDPEPAHELLRYIKESHIRRPAAAYDYSYSGGGQQQPGRRPVLVPSGPAPVLAPGPTPGLVPGSTPVLDQVGSTSGLVHSGSMPILAPPGPTPGLVHPGSTPALIPPGLISGVVSAVQPQQPQQFPPAGLRPFEPSQYPRPLVTGIPQVAPQPPAIDVSDLLSKLVSSGVLTTKQQDTQTRSATPPISSKHRYDENVEQRSTEPNHMDFSVGSMKIRYKSVIDTLYQQKIQCSTCGLRFTDNDRQKYSKHLDWHFQQSRRDKDKSTSRPWYFAADDWIRYEEMPDENTPKVKSAVFEKSQKESRQQTDDAGRPLVASTDSVIPASDDNQECSVCGEKFEQFWDEDDEIWNMRNAALIRGKAYHPLCYQDISSVDAETEAVPVFVPSSLLPDDFMSSEESNAVQ